MKSTIEDLQRQYDYTIDKIKQQVEYINNLKKMIQDNEGTKLKLTRKAEELKKVIGVLKSAMGSKK
jgi:hypothetical protein